MAGLLLPTRKGSFPSKPPPGASVDRAHPLASGLRFVLPHNEGGGGLLINAANRSEFHAFAPGTRKWMVGPGGDGVYWNKDNTAARAALNRPMDWGTPAQMTMAILVSGPATLTSVGVIWESSISNNDGQGRFIMYHNSSGNVIVFELTGASQVWTTSIGNLGGAHVYT